MHDYRAIFLDIDGTLTQPGHSAPPASAVAAIESARRLGRRVFLCTGRCEAMLKPLLHCADFDGYVASSGGLVVVGSRDVFDCPMTPQEQAHVLTALSDNGVFRTVQTRMGAYCDEGFRDFLRARDVQNGSSELLRWREAIEQRLQMQPMRDYGGEPVYSIVCMSPTRAQLDKAMAECSEFDFVLMDDRQHDLVNAETANRRYDKGSGVKQVCAAIGVDPADSICFGDSLNGLPRRAFPSAWAMAGRRQSNPRTRSVNRWRRVGWRRRSRISACWHKRRIPRIPSTESTERGGRRMRKRSCGERQWVICTGQRALMIAGIVLVAAGLIVLLLCIPAWAWAALLGVALAIAGLVLICVGRR